MVVLRIRHLPPFFWHLMSHWNFNWLFLICWSLSVSSEASSIAISYFGSAGSCTVVGFGWRSVSSMMISRARIASFNWMRHFSHLIGGSEAGRSQNGSIDSGVFRDSRADCDMSYMSYRFRYCMQSEFSGAKLRIYRSELLSISRSDFAITLYVENSIFWVLNICALSGADLALIYNLVFRLANWSLELFW